MEYIGFNGSQFQSYKYGFQGQERQAETGWSSFKWRNSIPELGRFFNVDPLAEIYNTWTPYAFSGNRVVDARELEGLEPVLLPAYGVGAMTPPPMYSGKAGAGSSIYETAKSNAINNYNGIVNLLGNNIKILTTLSGTGLTIANRVLQSEGDSDSSAEKPKTTLEKNKSKGKEAEKEVTEELKNEFPDDEVLTQVTGKFKDGKTTRFDDVIISKKTGKVKETNETKSSANSQKVGFYCSGIKLFN